MGSICSRYICTVLIGQLCAGLSPVFGQESLVREAEAKRRIVERLASGNEEQRLDAITELNWSLSTTPGSADFSILTTLANIIRTDTSPVVRALAARALEISGDSRAQEPLIAALGSEREVAVRKAIIYALARYKSREAMLRLVPLLKDKDQELRAAAAFALAEIRDPESAGTLLEFLQKNNQPEDAFARSLVVRALGFIGNQSMFDSLIEALTEDKSLVVRREAAQALGQLATQKDVKVLEALREARLSSDPYLTSIADAAIASISSRPH
jgi:HEAT repeat protein